jgi:hypothetical protein
MVKLRLVVGLASAGMALGLLAGCGGSGPGPASSGGTGGTGGSGTAGDAPGPASAGATTPAPMTYPGEAGAYATATVTAWSGGDSTRLGQLNDPADPIFSTLDSGNYNKAFGLYRCTGAAGSSICVLYNQVGDELDLRLQNSLLGQAHAVVDGQWHPITFPTDNRAYAEEAIHAWTGHNDAAVALLTGKPGATAFDPVPAPRRDDTWTFGHEEGGTGHLFYVFGNATGDHIVVSFANEGFATVPANRHGLIEVIYYQAH